MTQVGKAEDVARTWFEDLTVGRRFGFGTCQVTRDEVIDFARRYDPQPYHLNDEAAAANPIFGRLSASGLHTMAMANRLVHDGYAREGIRPVAGGGVDALRLLRPVFPGDTLRVELTVVEARPLKSRPGLGVVDMSTTVINQAGEPVMTQSGAFFIDRRPDAGSTEVTHG